MKAWLGGALAFALAVFGFFTWTRATYVGDLHPSANDPAQVLAVAGRIGLPGIPDGYHAGHTQLLSGAAVLGIDPDDADKSFVMSLTRGPLERPLGEEADQAAEFERRSMRFADCTLLRLPEDDIAGDIRTVRMAVRGCSTGGRDFRSEVGYFETSRGRVEIFAAGIGKDFDRKTLRTLVDSIDQ